MTLEGFLGDLEGEKFPTSMSGIYIQQRTLDMVVYGFSRSKDVVKNILYQADLYLQRPDDSDYDHRVKYRNPMYFTRPGEELPRLLMIND